MSRLLSAWRRWDSKWRETWAGDLSTPAARRRAVYDMNVNDHGAIRRFWTNRHEIAPGVWRSNQPSPRQVAEIAGLGVRTILNLRGESRWGSYYLEREACAAHGVALRDLRLYSRKPPGRDEILRLIEAFESVRYPILMHCKAGADRAGLAAAVYMIWAGHPPGTAAKQLGFRFYHVRQSKTGVLDAFVQAYAADHAATGIGFRDWITDVYDPPALRRSFRASSAGNFLVDRVLRRE